MDRLVFISHREVDANAAGQLVNLLLTVFDLPESDIRCTSVGGHKLDFGMEIDRQLQADLDRSTAVVALLTKQSLESKWVLFELGASWVYGKYLLPVLGPGVLIEDLPDPVRRRLCVAIDRPGALGDLKSALETMSSEIGLPLRWSARAERDLAAFISAYAAAAVARYDPDVETRSVSFRCNDPLALGAREVYVAGTFNNWLSAKDGHILREDAFRLVQRDSKTGRIWEREIEVPVGPHDFKFVVGENFWIHWNEQSGYAKGSDAPGGNNFRIVVT